MDFSDPLTILDYYLAELERRFDLLFNQTYNVNGELCACLELVYEILDGLDDIKLVLWKEKN